MVYRFAGALSFPLRCCCCQCQVDETNVLVLDESNFEQALAENDVLLLEFFAPWCGNCQRLKPRYARAAAALASEGSAGRLAKVCKVSGVAWGGLRVRTILRLGPC